MEPRFSIVFLVAMICGSRLCLANKIEYTSVIELPGGSKVQGFVHKPNTHTTVEVFEGIKFAEAERFGKPKMVTKWEGVLNATEQRYSCPQVSFTEGLSMSLFSKIIIGEDCLYLNIYRPVNITKNSKPLPVMFWIFGGAFQIGTAFTPLYDGTYISTIGDVILVAVNYRLGPLGFLYGGIEEAPGNQGIWDVLMGLKWVRANIKAFGGDPEKITVFGESAGSMITSALIMSPMSQGLFKRAIMQSGALISMITLDLKDLSLIKTAAYLQQTNCSNEESDMKKSIACLKKKSWQELTDAVNGSLSNLDNDQLFWPLFGVDDLLPENVTRLQKLDANIDLLYGVVHDEGTLFVSGAFPFVLEENFQIESVAQLRKMIDDVNKVFYLDNISGISEFYTRNLNISDKEAVRKAVGLMYGDLRLTCPTMLFGQTLAEKTIGKGNHIYSYRFDYRPMLSAFASCQKWMNVCHGSDVLYTFGIPMIVKGAFNQNDANLSKDIIKAWTTFAKTGHPEKMGSHTWKEAFGTDRKSPVQSASVMTMNIKDNHQMVDNYFKERCEGLWKNIMLKTK